MTSKLLIDAHYEDETRIAILDDKGRLENFESEHAGKKPIKGNIYLAKIVRIEPSIQAAFIDYGSDKHGFLPLVEIHQDYFNKNIVNSTEISDETGGKKKNLRNYKIQEVLSLKQIILVQAQKEPRGNKCAYFSTYLSLPGRYCVLFPNPGGTASSGVSKKIDSGEKDRLKNIIASIEIPNGMGCIIRTAGENRTKQEIKRDFEYLIRLWNDIRDSVTSSIAPAMIHEEGNIIKRTIRDLYNRNSDKILVQGQDAYKQARTFMKIFTPSHVKKIELYKDNETNVFQKFGVEEKIHEILNPIVKLPSGGTIVINPTEALTAIDVNSGKLKTERSIEDTALKTNLEAVSEIARQLKLRDIAGIIVIDFIDMDERNSILKVEKAFKDAVKDDYSSLQIGRISQFGLLELSRQRLRSSLSDSNFCQCQHCGGSGKILSNESSALLIIRKIEDFVINEDPKSVIVEVANGIDLFILNSKRKLLNNIETTYNTHVEIVRNAMLSPHECNITAKEYQETKSFEERKSSTKTKQTSEKLNNEELLSNKTNVKPNKNKDSEKRADSENRKNYSLNQKKKSSSKNAEEKPQLDSKSNSEIPLNQKRKSSSKNAEEETETKISSKQKKVSWLKKVFG